MSKAIVEDSSDKEEDKPKSDKEEDKMKNDRENIKESNDELKEETENIVSYSNMYYIFNMQEIKSLLDDDVMYNMVYNSSKLTKELVYKWVDFVDWDYDCISEKYRFLDLEFILNNREKMNKEPSYYRNHVKEFINNKWVLNDAVSVDDIVTIEKKQNEFYKDKRKDNKYLVIDWNIISCKKLDIKTLIKHSKHKWNINLLSENPCFNMQDMMSEKRIRFIPKHVSRNPNICDEDLEKYPDYDFNIQDVISNGNLSLKKIEELNYLQNSKVRQYLINKKYKNSEDKDSDKDGDDRDDRADKVSDRKPKNEVPQPYDLTELRNRKDVTPEFIAKYSEQFDCSLLDAAGITWQYVFRNIDNIEKYQIYDIMIRLKIDKHTLIKLEDAYGERFELNEIIKNIIDINYDDLDKFLFKRGIKYEQNRYKKQFLCNSNLTQFDVIKMLNDGIKFSKEDIISMLT